MAEKTEEFRRTVVRLSLAEMQKLLIRPARDQGMIDFDPTRVTIANKQGSSGDYVITFERVETNADSR